MPRKPRVQQPGMIHHIIVRGNNKESIFKEDNDKIRYLQLLERYKKRHLFKLLAYCIMDNHVHLLIKQNEVSLSKTMQGIQQSYTQFYNKKYDCIGHVFHQRFKSIPVADDAYLITLIAYIHKNPKVAGIVNNLNEYRWSSHLEIIKPGKKDVADVFYLFDLIDRDINEVLPEYLWILGEVNEEQVKAQYLKGKKLEERRSEIYINDRKGTKEKKIFSIDQIVLFLDKYNRSNKLCLNSACINRLLVLLSDVFCNESDDEISRSINLSKSRISGIRGEFYDDKIGVEILRIYKDIKYELNGMQNKL